jgi:protein-S-isoprenylcysteine O-methyltransferase Ste14
LVVAVLFILLCGNLELNELSLFSFVALYLTGAMIRIGARRINFEHTRLREISAPNLIQTGVYSISRNPLYLSNLCIILAFLTFNADIIQNIILFFLVILHYHIVALTERDFLIQKFAQNYFNWAQNTPFWLGFFKYIPSSSPRQIKTALLCDFWTWFFHILVLGLFLCKIFFY